MGKTGSSFFHLVDLEILHRIERLEQTGLVGIHVQPGVLQGKEELVGGLERGQAPGGGLALDGVPAGRARLDADPRQALEERVFPGDSP